MAWNIKATLIEACSCAAVCPCTLGPAKPDQGWCSSSVVLKIDEGRSDGVDLTGAKLAVAMELPGDFMSGIDKAKLYLDPSISDEQRRELEAIFHGEKGGLWGGMREAIGKWLPSAVTAIEFDAGDSPRGAVKGAGKITMQRVRTEDGKQATLHNAPIAVAFGESVLELGFATGSGWSDSDLRSFESLGFGSVAHVDWSA
jgi:hypothetical protein